MDNLKIIQNYKSYDDYINHQLQKTIDPIKRKKWLNEEWICKINIFKNVFNKLIKLGHLEKNMKCLCMGARTGQEVVALNELGMNSIGIDIYPCEPHVIKGDIHNVDFNDNSFDFIFTNIFDHSL